MPPSLSIEEILAAREETHGSVAIVNDVYSDFHTILDKYVDWTGPARHYRYVLEMILMKLARLIAGRVQVEEHWTDISGYAELARQITRY